MKKSINSFFKNILSENYIGPLDIESITDVDINEKKNELCIQFTCSDGRTPTLKVKYTDFVQWAKKFAVDLNDLIKKFLIDFFSDAQPSELNEIIDKDENIMADDDMPNNATDTMVGSSNWDLEKFAQHGVPKPSAYYTGSFSNGFVVW